MSLISYFTPKDGIGPVNAGLRHVYTAGATTFTIMSVLALIPQDQVQPLIDSLHKIGDAVQTIMGEFSKMWIILGPVAVILVGKAATVAASFRSQTQSVTTQAATDPKKAAALATATVENVPGVVQIAAIPEIALATPNPDVIPIEHPVRG